MLSLVDMAVTRADADAYALSRGLSDWTGTDLVKDQALRRGQDYIAGVYNTRWVVTFSNADAPVAVKYAIIEAALREIKVPFSLTPDIVLGQQKILTKVGSLGWQPMVDQVKASDLKPVLTSIEGMLDGLFQKYRGGFVV